MLGKLSALRRELGWREGSLYLLDQALARASGGHARLIRYVIVAQPVGRPGATAMRPDRSTHVEPVPAGHPLTAQFPRPAEVISRRYASGARCVSASVGGSFAGYLWWQGDTYEEDEVHCRYRLEGPQRCTWDFDVYVEPRYRAGRMLARLWAAADTQFAADGVRWSFSRIASSNRASLAAHARLGAVERCRAAFLLLGPLQFAWLPGWPWLRLSIGHIGRPELRLRSPDDPNQDA
jgi:hypothetical protein